jgi:hypothetical protein
MVHRLPRGKTPRPPVVSVGATATSLPLANPPGARGQGGKGARGQGSGGGGQWIGHPARIAETTLDLTRQITSPIAAGQG